ncbi:hypothetical protein BB561_003973 [Smittium simulii]|uniref:Coiled-coil domain-containing protein 47 n=1 Tax=Smittium simulii TaxID=133385 RepID=A0A2T9YIP9_9FUNG|nr:hypothetical protein BB561_003973 [Smittium simulii]
MGFKSGFFACLLTAYSIASEELHGAVQHEPSGSTDPLKTSSNPAAKPSVNFSFEAYKFEALILCVLIVYGIFFVKGRAVNMKIFEQIEQVVTDVLRENFTDLAQPLGKTLERDSVSDALFWASGRRNCQSLNGHLKPRHDLIGLATSILESSEDFMKIEISLNDKAPDFVFALVPKNKHRTVLKSRFDVGAFAKPIKVEDLGEKFTAMSEHSDFLQGLKNSNLFTNFSQSDCLLSELYITDQPQYKPTAIPFFQNKRLIAKIKIPQLDSNGVDLLKNTIEYILYLVDYTCNDMNIRPELVNKQKKVRQEAYKDLHQQAEKQKKDEQTKIALEKKKIKLESFERLSPEQRRKAEEKLRTKEEKKRIKKRSTIRA